MYVLKNNFPRNIALLLNLHAKTSLTISQATFPITNSTYTT